MRVELELAGIRHLVGDQRSAPTSKVNSPKHNDGSGITPRTSRNLIMPLISMNSQSLPSLSVDMTKSRNSSTIKTSPSPRKMQMSAST